MQAPERVQVQARERAPMQAQVQAQTRAPMQARVQVQTPERARVRVQVQVQVQVQTRMPTVHRNAYRILHLPLPVCCNLDKHSFSSSLK